MPVSEASPPSTYPTAQALRLAERRRRRWVRRGVFAAIASLWIATAWWHMQKPMAEGLRQRGPMQTLPAQKLTLLTDLTWTDARGQPGAQHEIFAATLQLIAEARDFLVLDYFLLNDFGIPQPPDARLQPLSAQLCDALLARKRAEPSLPILLLVDPINAGYSRELPPRLAALKTAGIDVVLVDLDPLRDSNAGYSAPWRLLVRWWSPPGARGGALPDPLDARGTMSFGQLARLLNFKSDHRKLAITGDDHGSLLGIVSSANPHDASSAHSNIGLKLEGPALLPLLQSALAVARMSGWTGSLPLPEGAALTAGLSGPSTPPPPGPGETQAHVAVATEGAIGDALLQRLNAAGRGDAIDVAMFYLSDRRTVHALVRAATRGAAVRVILDPNKDAFGREKSGLPNRQVASELVAASDGAIRLRWYRTHGEQFHAKIVVIRSAGALWFTLGSANLTRRNLDDYNLEANVIVELPRGSALDTQLAGWFDALWSNRGVANVEYTADVDVYADPSQLRYWQYRVMESTGLSTF